MVRIIDSRLEEELTSPSDKFLIVQPEKRVILVNYKEQFPIAEEMARKLESPGKEYTILRCYDL